MSKKYKKLVPNYLLTKTPDSKLSDGQKMLKYVILHQQMKEDNNNEQ